MKFSRKILKHYGLMSRSNNYVRTRFLLLDMTVVCNEQRGDDSSFIVPLDGVDLEDGVEDLDGVNVGSSKRVSKLPALILSTLSRIFLKRLISRSRFALIRTLEILSPRMGSFLKCSTLLLNSVCIDVTFIDAILLFSAACHLRSNHDQVEDSRLRERFCMDDTSIANRLHVPVCVCVCVCVRVRVCGTVEGYR